MKALRSAAGVALLYGALVAPYSPSSATSIDPVPTFTISGDAPARTTFTLDAPIRLDYSRAHIVAPGSYGGVVIRAGKHDYGGVATIDAVTRPPTDAVPGAGEVAVLPVGNDEITQPLLPAGTYTAYLLGDNPQAMTAVTIPLVSGSSVDLTAADPSTQALVTKSDPVNANTDPATEVQPVSLSFNQAAGMKSYVFGAYWGRFDGQSWTDACLIAPPPRPASHGGCTVTGHEAAAAETAATALSHKATLGPAGFDAGRWGMRYTLTSTITGGGSLNIAVLQLTL